MGLPSRTKERRQVKLAAVLAVAVLAIIGVAAYKVASGVGGKPHVVAAAAVRTSPASTKSRPSSAPSSASASASVSPSVSPSSASPSPSPVTVVAQTLKPSGVTAVGPGGAAGDDAAAANFVIDGSTSTAWQTDWYATPEFGGLQTGTGLLINMGRSVTITSVQVTLGSEAGADFQVRVGDSSTVSDLTTVATEAGAGGTVRLKLTSPVQARYVLIWLTKLAPDGQGTYQAKIYNVTMTGQP
jgi:F5/8 type C domain